MSEPRAGTESAPALAGLAHELSGVAVIAQRDVTKLLRDRPRLAVNLAFPVLLIGGLGSILQPTVGRVTGLNAVKLAFTGVLAGRLFQSAALRAFWRFPQTVMSHQRRLWLRLSS